MIKYGTTLGEQYAEWDPRNRIDQFPARFGYVFIAVIDIAYSNALHLRGGVGNIDLHRMARLKINTTWPGKNAALTPNSFHKTGMIQIPDI